MDLSKEAVENAEQAYLHDRENRHEAAQDLRFIANDQWDPEDVRRRNDENRPSLTSNLLINPVKNIANAIRMATPSVRVMGIDRDADAGTANVFAGLIRQVQRVSMATWVYSQATSHAAMCGIGHFRVETRFAGEDTFDQEVGISLIPHPLSVLWDPAAVKPDRSDARFCLVLQAMPLANFKAEYPDASHSDFNMPHGFMGNQFQWYREDVVVVAEYWKMVEKMKTIGQLEDGSIIDLTNIKALPMGARVVRTRKVKSYDVHQCVVNGREQLTEMVKWPGRHIPIIPVIGHEIPQEHTTIRHGVVRFARDPQRLYNYWRSAEGEWLQQGTKAQWLATPEQIGEHKAMWDNAHVRNRNVLLYERDPDAPGDKPERLAPPQMPGAFTEQAMIAANEIKQTTGVYEATMGQKSNETSGLAIDRRRMQGETNTYEYTDNLGVALNRCGEVMIDLIPNVYDTQRTLMILDEEEREQFVPINAHAYTQDGEPVLIHDLSVGKYRTAISMGSSVQTRRIEAQEAMMEFVKSSPELFAITADLVAEGMEWPIARKFAERIKRTIPPEILGEEAEPQEPDPIEQITAELEMAGKQAEVENIQADTEQKLAKAKKELASIETDRMEAQEKWTLGATMDAAE